MLCHHELKDKAKSQIVCTASVAASCCSSSSSLEGWGSTSTTAAGGLGGTAAAAKWDGKSPFTCSGNDNLRLNGVSAKLSTTAITASGNCHLTLVNVDVTAPTGIEAGVNAVVTVQGGSITGTTFAIHATANAKVDVTGAKVSGKTQAAGVNAKVTGV